MSLRLHEFAAPPLLQDVALLAKVLQMDACDGNADDQRLALDQVAERAADVDNSGVLTQAHRDPPAGRFSQEPCRPERVLPDEERQPAQRADQVHGIARCCEGAGRRRRNQPHGPM
eukprot:10019612-Alexandrium_andersonii.AAC.1